MRESYSNSVPVRADKVAVWIPQGAALPCRTFATFEIVGAPRVAPELAQQPGPSEAPVVANGTLGHTEGPNRRLEPILRAT